jgi:hypothetical protein
VALAILAACSQGGTPSRSPTAAVPTSARPTTPSAAPPTTAGGPPTVTPSAEPSPARPTPIPVRGLPEQGVAVTRDGAVELNTVFDGSLVERLDGFSIYRSTDAPGNVVLVRDGTFYVLESFERVLRPLPSERAAQRRQGPGDNPRLDLPLPESGRRRPLGHWRYALHDPHYGDRVLAQWSGECETPTAFFVDRDEGEVVAVTGESSLAEAPESIALGWTKRGQAVVFLPEAACGSGVDVPGIYLFRTAGRPRLLVETAPGAEARMWGTAIAD